MTLSPAAIVERARARATILHVALLAALAFVPSLTSAPGRMPTDTKLFLYLDPTRLTGDSLYAWDSRQFAGWVPHQTVSYLWPSGPWYSFFSGLGVPDWVAHRLWIATLMLVAGLGVRWVARLLGLSASGAIVAALFYQLTPYVLPYISRTSTMLLPWAGLGWLIGLTIRAATRTKWRDVAIFGLVITTIGATNATAILMIAPGPVLWLIHATWQRTLAWRQTLVLAAKLGGISLIMSAWWIAMLLVQGRYGADVLGYSETLEAVSLTSSSPEVLRGLGYWLFYVRDPVGFTTTASFDYMASGRVIAITFLVLGVALLGLVVTRWTARRFAVLLVFVGVVLAVGVHPIQHPSPLMSALAGNSRSSLALAMRSSTRALPLSTLGFALGAGALATAIARTRWRLPVRRLAPVLLGLLAIVNLPVLWKGAMVDPILERDEQPPAAWQQATADLDALPSGYRVFQLPGIEFGAYRWGYTVDPPLPGLTDRPLVTRDLLPLGSSAAMDTLYAFDDRFQDGTAELAAVAPIARLFGADTIWLPNDVAFDRFRTPRPELTAAMFANPAATDDLGVARTFGPAAPNAPTVSVVDEDSVSNSLVGTALPGVTLVPVTDPQPIVRAKTTVVVVAGSGDGLVDAAAAGLITGHELIRYAADLAAPEDARDGDDQAARSTGGIAAADRVIVTDSNRDRAHQWHGSQDVWGYTEDGSSEPAVLDFDSSDQRIPVFVDQTTADQTVAIQVGGLRAVASGYGEPFAYRPESRAAMSVDADPDTAWVVSDRDNAVGQRLRLFADEAFAALRVVQPLDSRNRWITALTVHDASGSYTVALDDSSRTAAGQAIALRTPSTTVTMTIAATAQTAAAAWQGADAVGFADVASSVGPSEEIVRVPSNVLTHVGADQPLDIVLTRLRTRPTNRWRSDPEPTMVRSFALDKPRTFAPTITTRIDQRATDAVLAELLGWAGTTADRRLAGVPSMGGWAATDGDATTQWATPFGDAVGSTLTVPLATPLAGAATMLTLQQPGGDRGEDQYSTITAVRVASDSGEQTIAVPSPDADGISTIEVAGLAGNTLRVTITATDGATTVDRRYAEPVLLPAAIRELAGNVIIPAALPTTFVSTCRSDILTVDSDPVALAMAGTVSELFANEPMSAELCGAATNGIALGSGEHIVRTAAGRRTGIAVDRLVLSSAGDDPAASAASAALPKSESQPRTTVTNNGRVDRTVTVEACPDGCWLVFGEGFNTGWTASIDGHDLGTQTQVDGGFNGWYLPPSQESRSVHLEFQGQTRLTLGIALSALGALACVAMIVFDRRRRDPMLADPPHFVPGWIPARQGRITLSSPAVTTTVAALVVGALAISPVWGLICAAITAVIGFGLRRPQLLGPAAVVMIGGLAAIMLRRFLALTPFANAGWPGVFEDLHRPGMAAVVVLLVSVVDHRVTWSRAVPGPAHDPTAERESERDRNATPVRSVDPAALAAEASE